MNNSGDAAEQVVRLSLEGTEVALKLTGSAAKNIAAAIYAAFKNRDKTKVRGPQRLTAMLKSGRELKVFTVSEEHLKQFATEARRYGVVYCALRGREQSADGMVDVMVRAEDAGKINRIVERFKLATVDAATIKSEIERSREGKTGADKAAAPAVPEQAQPQKSKEDRLLDEMLGAPTKQEAAATANPSAARADKSLPSGPTSEKQGRTAEGAAKAEGRLSVRKELREIKTRRQQEAEPVKREEPAKTAKKQNPKTIRHKQPARKKPKKYKER